MLYIYILFFYYYFFTVLKHKNTIICFRKHACFKKKKKSKVSYSTLKCAFCSGMSILVLVCVITPTFNSPNSILTPCAANWQGTQHIAVRETSKQNWSEMHILSIFCIHLKISMTRVIFLLHVLNLATRLSIESKEGGREKQCSPIF